MESNVNDCTLSDSHQQPLQLKTDRNDFNWNAKMFILFYTPHSSYVQLSTNTLIPKPIHTDKMKLRVFHVKLLRINRLKSLFITNGTNHRLIQCICKIEMLKTPKFWVCVYSWYVRAVGDVLQYITFYSLAHFPSFIRQMNKLNLMNKHDARVYTQWMCMLLKIKLKTWVYILWLIAHNIKINCDLIDGIV